MIRKSIQLPRTGILLSLSSFFLAPVAGGQALQSLHSFDGANGAEPVAALVQGNDGNFYSTTTSGGASNLGTVFKITPDGELTTLVSFDGSNGAEPRAELLQGSDGSFYGTTSKGGASDLGTVFRMTPAGALTTLVTFTGFDGADPNGAGPWTGLVQGSDGNFYGTTSSVLGGPDTLFRMLPDGTLTTLLILDGFPEGELVQGSDGHFYGTTSTGGENGDGTVFRMTPAGTLTTLFSFQYGVPPNHNPAQPEAALVEGDDGNFYGTTAVGGRGNPIGRDAGTVYKITPGGVLTTLVSFNNVNGSGPLAGLVKGRDGNFYGTTSGGGAAYDGGINYGFGTIFMITHDGTLTSLVSFNGTDGDWPEAELVQGSDGNFYGTTAEGGTNDKGTIFRLVMSPLHSFADWAASFGLSGVDAAAGADPDGDALPNGAEYILRANPTVPATSGHPAATVSGGNMIVTFPRDDASETPDVTLTVEAGNDLVAWPAVLSIGRNTADSSPGVTIVENGVAPDTVTITIPQGTDKAIFARLKVTIAQ